MQSEGVVKQNQNIGAMYGLPLVDYLRPFVFGRKTVYIWLQPYACAVKHQTNSILHRLNAAQRDTAQTNYLFIELAGGGMYVQDNRLGTDITSCGQGCHIDDLKLEGGGLDMHGGLGNHGCGLDIHDGLDIHETRA